MATTVSGDSDDRALAHYLLKHGVLELEDVLAFQNAAARRSAPGLRDFLIARGRFDAARFERLAHRFDRDRRSIRAPALVEESETSPITEGALALCAHCDASWEDQGQVRCPQCGTPVAPADRRDETLLELKATTAFAERLVTAQSAHKDRDALIGKTLGGCVIEQQLGEGAMGVVYRAHHQRLGMPVALKLLRCETGDGARERFRREARLAASIEHHHIVPITNIGEEDGYHYIVMQYMDGGSMGRVLRRYGPGRPLPPRFAVRVIRDAALGLAEAHRKGVIHRDVKPDNLLLTGAGVVKVADFGLAKSAAAESQAVTLAGAVVGSPAYMAPEQCRGERADQQSDLYGLGVTLFHLLAGRLPFTAENVLIVMLKHESEPPPSVSSYAPGIPAELEALTQALLEKSAARRPSSAQDLASRLTGILESGFADHDAVRRIISLPRLLVEQGRLGGAELAAVRDHARSLGCRLTAAPPGSSGTQAAAAGAVGECAADKAQPFEGDAITNANTLTDCLKAAGAPEGALRAAAGWVTERERVWRRYLARMRGQRSSVRVQSPAQQAQAQLERCLDQARNAIERGRGREALADLFRELQRRGYSGNDPRIRRRLGELQRLEIEVRRLKRAREAPNAPDAPQDQEDSDQALSWNRGGVQRMRARAFQEAEVCFRKALSHAPGHPLYAENCARALVAQRKLQAAEDLLTRVLDLQPDQPRVFAARGKVRVRRRCFGAAAEDFTAAIRMGGSDPAWNQARARCLERQERLAEALRQMQRACRMHPGDSDLHAKLGALALRAWDTALAERHLKHAVRLDKERPEPFFHLGVLLTARGDHDRALSMLRKAMKKRLERAHRIRTDARLEALRAHPRFAELLAALNRVASEQGESDADDPE